MNRFKRHPRAPDGTYMINGLVPERVTEMYLLFYRGEIERILSNDLTR